MLDNQVTHFNHIVDKVVDLLRCCNLLLLHLRIGCLRECSDGTLLGLAGIVEWHMKVCVDFIQSHRDELEGLIFHLDRVDSVIAVGELDDALFAVSDGHIVFNLEILHALDETTLDISGG